MKTCSICKETKSYESFTVMKTAKDGRHPYCRECASAKNRAAYELRGRESWLNDKICRWCNVLKPRDAFPKVPGSNRVGPRCNACVAETAQRESEGLRRCGTCREWLPTEAFYPSSLIKPHINCVMCSRSFNQQPEAMLNRRSKTLVKEYGITLDQYKELLEKQGHKCPICLETFEPNNFSYPVDHSHGGLFEGRIRAVLHRDCNRFVMWMHEDSAQLRRAADLIDNPLTDWIVPKPTLNERRREKERRK